MANTTPPAKVRHLRLVPPLLESEATTPEGVEPHLAQGVPAPWESARTAARIMRAATVATCLTVVAWGTTRLAHHKDGGNLTADTPGVGTRRLGFEAFAQGDDSHHLGRPLLEGDTLGPKDRLVITLHNHPGPGAEAAQFAAIFALDKTQNMAAIYPAAGDDASPMALPRVASLALLDGPQLSAARGPITLVTIFMRAPVAMRTLQLALAQTVAQTAEGDAWLLPALGDSVMALQRLTLTAPIVPNDVLPKIQG
jgi:hypothetical protein